MTSKLEKIVIQRRADVIKRKDEVNVYSLMIKQQGVEKELGGCKNLYEEIKNHGTTEMFVAAEFKRASPSKGDIAVDVDIQEQARKYGEAGAGLISVLTEECFFKGSLEDMLAARKSINEIKTTKTGGRPLVLRKDFIIDEYQLYEARAFGADTILLMFSILSEEEVKALLEKARTLGMEPLVEVVNESEMKSALRVGAKVIGVNNRNLHTFKVDMETTPRMVQVARDAGQINNIVVLALSGIKTRQDVSKYEKFGNIAGLLIGETLMRAPDPGAMISSLVRESSTKNNITRVKVCGINDPESALVAAKAGADFIGMIFVKKSSRFVTNAKAKEIVDAIRGFREKDGRIDIPHPTTTNQGDSDPAVKRQKKFTDWFPAWSQAIGDACDGQGRPLVVGVFMNHSIQEIKEIVDETGIDLIQLHGSETLMDEANCPLPTVRVIHVDSEDAQAVKDEDLTEGPASLLLLDTSVKGASMGGTGKTFDWTIAKDVKERTGCPVIMAGGLTPENVARAVKAGSPWGVDVASGVESSPGVKDHTKIRAFVKNAKAAC